jgi:aryl-alcohol dehydrogenase-like predicted oxidoreductase
VVKYREMPLSDYVSLGRSGLRVSPFCLGAMTFGKDWGWGSSVEDSKRILDRYIDLGGNFIDTANGYTKGNSEKIIGDHVGRHPARRDRLVIATKFFTNMYAGDPNAGGASRKSLVSACDHSLRRLQTDYIDLYWMHCWDRFTPIEETIRALDDLVSAGKVRYLGFSDTPAWKVTQAQITAQFHGWTPLVALQLEYSLLERTIEGELIPAALEFGLGVTPWSPLRSGILTGKYTRESVAAEAPARGHFVTRSLNDETFRVVQVLKTVAAEAGTTPARAALAWVQQRPGVTSSIIGARTMEQLEDNLGALETKLTPEQIKTLDDASQPKLNFPHDFIRNIGGFGYNGATIDGIAAPANPMSPQNDQERY